MKQLSTMGVILLTMGKGENCKQKKKGTMHIDDILIDLRWVIQTENEFSKAAKFLMEAYQKQGHLTQRQQQHAEGLIHKTRKQRIEKRRTKNYFLYAIDDGVHIKIGVSLDPKARLKNMQTGHPQKLRIIWKLSLGPLKGRAYTAEKKMHKFLCDYHKRGEWFTRECMAKINQFKWQA